MKKVFKVIFTIIFICLLIYVVYRNINLRTIPSSDLIKDEATSRLYYNLLPNTGNGEYTNYYFSHNKVDVEDIPSAMKYNIAYKNTGSGESILKEEIIKKEYEEVFGPDSYKSVKSFVGGCNTYTYDDVTLIYKKATSEVCKANNISILSKIVDASISGNNMDIEVAIAYIDNNKKMVYKSCNDDLTSCSNVLKKNFTEFDEADLDVEEYDLHKFKFTYQLNNEEYYFKSVSKVK